MLHRAAQALRSRRRLAAVLAPWSARKIRLARTPAGVDGERTVTTLDLEQYVAGALAGEMDARWSAEALNVGATISRSYALWRIVHPRAEAYDLVAGSSDQHWAPPDRVDARHSAAIDATRGQYLVPVVAGVGLLHPLLAQFHASCGGATDAGDSVWGDRRARAIPCPACRTGPEPWTVTLPRQKLLRGLGLASAMTDNPLRIQSLRRSPSGRVLRLRVVVGDETTDVSGEELRAALGHSVVKSTLMSWEVGPTEVTFTGRGHGHGAGLCVRGCVTLASRGWTAAAIMSHYYPHTAVRRLPRSRRAVH